MVTGPQGEGRVCSAPVPRARPGPPAGGPDEPGRRSRRINRVVPLCLMSVLSNGGTSTAAAHAGEALVPRIEDVGEPQHAVVMPRFFSRGGGSWVAICSRRRDGVLQSWLLRI